MENLKKSTVKKSFGFFNGVIFKKFKKFIKKALLLFLILFILVLAYFFVGSAPEAKEIKWGVNFSQKHSESLGLDWKENYSALLDDLGAKNLKIAVNWDLIEPENGRYYFDDLDWQARKAEEKEAGMILVIGIKTSRWPECHIPSWAVGLNKEEQQKEILEMIEKIVLRYKDNPAVSMWQVENEPLFPFGECPAWVGDREFLKKEIELVRNLDYKKRPVIISDSGEFSFWAEAAGLGDVVGITLYQKVWFQELSLYISYPFRPVYYWRKAQIIKKLFNKRVMVVELQAEPWGPTLLYDLPLEEQKKTMDLRQFRKNINFAKKTGFDEFYLWGDEWWYWLKEKQNQPEIWNEAKKLFRN